MVAEARLQETSDWHDRATLAEAKLSKTEQQLAEATSELRARCATPLEQTQAMDLSKIQTVHPAPGHQDPAHAAHAAKMEKSRHSVERAHASLLAALSNYDRLAHIGEAAIKRTTKASERMKCMRDKRKTAERASVSETWPRLTIPPVGIRPHRDASFHLIRCDVHVLRGIALPGDGTVREIEKRAVAALNDQFGIKITNVVAFGKGSYGGSIMRGSRSLHMSDSVIAHKVHAALAAVPPDGPQVCPDMVVHLAIHGSGKGEGYQIYAKAMRGWAEAGGLLVFAVDRAIFNAIYVSPRNLKRLAGANKGQGIVEFLQQQDPAARDFMMRYIAFYAKRLPRTRARRGAVQGAAPPPEWEVEMSERSTMCARLGGIAHASDTYATLASLVHVEDVQFPGLAPPGPLLAATRRGKHRRCIRRAAAPVCRDARVPGCGCWCWGSVDEGGALYPGMQFCIRPDQR